MVMTPPHPHDVNASIVAAGPDLAPPPSARVARAHQALDWLARRHDGESVALIAHRAGVSPATVAHATSPYGPFPQATHHLGRTIASNQTREQRTRRWVQQRRAGRTVADIARDDGVAHQRVSRATIDQGPFPSPDVVTAWVHARRHGKPIGTIANDWGVRPATIRHTTKPHGPFHAAGPRLPDGIVGVTGISDLTGVSAPTVTRWVANGLVPPPDFVTARGRSLWLSGTITAWVTTTNALRTCPDCGARCLRLGPHRRHQLLTSDSAPPTGDQ